jgi:hypothetical protein
VNSQTAMSHCDLDSFSSTMGAMDGVAHFRYGQGAAIMQKVTTMAFTRSINVEPAVIRKTRCEMNYACLTGKPVCHVEPFIDRDVQLLRCLDEKSCAFRKNYQGRLICTCPVNRAAFSLN